MPLIDDLLTSFHGANYFTTIDLEAAFYQINLKKDSRELTAFITQDGLYEFNVLPMGLGFKSIFSGKLFHLRVVV